jgi:TrmH family RNA methyltransferase
MITSTKNPKVQWVRGLQARARDRRREKVFVVEGVRMAEEAVQSGWQARLVFYTDGLSARSLAVVEELRKTGVDIEQVSEGVMRSACDTETPQGILVVIEEKGLQLPGRLDFVLILDQVRDPGNLGSILRTAAAAGVQLVFLPPDTADPYSPKVIRAGMGAHFRIPIRNASWEDILQCLKDNDLRIFLADSSVGSRYDDIDYQTGLALIIGGEARGASSRADERTDLRVHIPMPGGGESLNAAAAAAILLFEIARQRGTQS